MAAAKPRWWHPQSRFALDLNTFNFTFIAAGMLLHWRPRSFLRAVTRSVPATAGVLIQFPFYAGIFGIISKTAVETRLAELFVDLTTKHTFLVIVALRHAGSWILRMASHDRRMVRLRRALLVLAREGAPDRALLLRAIGATFLISAAITGDASRGRHLAWIAFLAIGSLSWVAA